MYPEWGPSPLLVADPRSLSSNTANPPGPRPPRARRRCSIRRPHGEVSVSLWNGSSRRAEEHPMTTKTGPYAARLDVDYPEKLDRVTTAFRIFWIIPIAIVLSVLSATATSTTTVVTASGEVLAQFSRSGGGIVGALFGATLLMILFRQRYPRWWFDFALQFHRFSARV